MERRTFLRAGLGGVAAAGLTAPLASGLLLADRGSTRWRIAAEPIRLSSNENPLGLSDAAREAVIASLGEANRYPGPYRQAVIDALAAKHEVRPEQIVLGAGSTEILQMAVQARGPNATVIVADPTFEDVPRYAERIGIRVEKVPLRADYSHDLERMREVAARSSGPVLVYICNPNNPTGTVTPSSEIDAWIEEAPESIQFVVDEAYYEYAADPRYRSAQRWVYTKPNVLVVRTFSKIYAMAGMRLGYAVAHSGTAEHLARWAAANNANTLALIAARASLGDREFERKSLEVNRRGREILTKCLDELGLEHLPSHTNFVMHRINGDLPTYNRRMEEHGILVGRPFPPMVTHSRVSVGLPEEMERFAETLRMFRKRGWV